ncbi:hypothetical protein SAMN04489759_10577 [Sulfitobacter delicatus]|uniref:Uncharacterized protein n=2 Tax=Sulfitobacter delicatus TaxID=218672 RepID=A0A1G7S381_9RHOB|nr:hypothetical protein SAMN04489759_10577 [Sulfitobacter delicatus]
MTDGMARVKSIVFAGQGAHDVGMKQILNRLPRPALWLSLAALGAAACAPLNTYYKPGANVAQVSRATTACEVQALRDVPVSTQVRREPPRYIPPRQICDANNNCVTKGGFYVPGELVTFDPNVALRKRVETQCMADRGFAPVSIPACPASVARAAPARATTTLPALNENSCVIRNDGGSFQIVTRG